MNNKIVVITLNYNQTLMTIECMQSVLASDYKNYTVILIDNGSEHENYQQLVNTFEHEDKVRVFRIEENCGYVGGINYGLEKASWLDPDYFLIMNNDTKIDSEAISYLVDAGIRHQNKAIISGKVYHYDEPNRIQYIGGIMQKQKYLLVNNPGKNVIDTGQFEKEEERDMLDDVFWLIPSKIYKEIGKYSNHFFLYAEQGDYARRVLNAGYKLIYTPKAKIWHKGSITTGNGDRYSPHVNYWRKKGSVIYRSKHLKKKHFWMYSFNLLFRFFFKYIINKLKGKKEISTKKLAACRGVWDGILWTFNKKENKGFNPFLK